MFYFFGCTSVHELLLAVDVLSITEETKTEGLNFLIPDLNNSFISHHCHGQEENICFRL